MPPNDDRSFIELDGRGRASLKLYAGDRRYYLIDVDQPSGVITLTPAVVMTATEFALARHPGLAKRIEDFPDDPGRRKGWIHDLLVESGGPLKFEEIFQAVEGAGFAGNREEITGDLADLVREGQAKQSDAKNGPVRYSAES